MKHIITILAIIILHASLSFACMIPEPDEQIPDWHTPIRDCIYEISQLPEPTPDWNTPIRDCLYLCYLSKHTNPVPIPGSVILLSFGLAGIISIKRKKHEA